MQFRRVLGIAVHCLFNFLSELFSVSGLRMGWRKGKRGNCVVTRIHSQAPRPLPRSQLPLVRDVDLALEDAVERLLVSKEEAVKTVSCDIEDIYRNASIPTIHPQKVRQKVASVLELRRNAVKNLAVDQRTGKVRV